MVAGGLFAGQCGGVWAGVGEGGEGGEGKGHEGDWKVGKFVHRLRSASLFFGQDGLA